MLGKLRDLYLFYFILFFKYSGLQIFILFFLGFIYLFLERGEGGRKRGRETSTCGRLPCGPHWGPSHNPGMWPDWELKRRPFGSQPVLNPLSYTSHAEL